MTEQEPTVHDTDGAVTATGHPQVDSVLRTLETLDGLPVEEHVAVFEAAHASLRDALRGAEPAAAQAAAQAPAQG